MSTGADGIELVCCHAGGYQVALPAASVLGLAAATGDPAVPALAVLLGLAAGADAGRARELCIAPDADDPPPTLVRRVRVAEPVTRLRLPAGALQPVPPLLAARLRLPALHALALSGSPPTLLLVLRPRFEERPAVIR